MGFKEWINKYVLRTEEKKIEEENKVVTKEPIETVIDFKEVMRAVGNIKGSAEAVERVMQIFKMNNIKVFEKVKVDACTWNSYILHTERGSFLVKFSNAWLWNYGKMFNRPEPEGAGLNLHLAKYCQANGVDQLLIVRGDGMIYQIGINDLLDYATTHNTIRAEKESFEAHIPTTILKIFTLRAEVEKCRKSE